MPRRRVKIVRPEHYTPDPKWEVAATLPPHIGEADFQEHCEQVARRYGWLVHHAADSRRADPGLPDLIMLSPIQADNTVTLVMLELKTQKGKLLTEQEQWQLRLGLVDRVVTGVLRPSGWANYVALTYDPQGVTTVEEGVPPMPEQECSNHAPPSRPE